MLVGVSQDHHRQDQPQILRKLRVKREHVLEVIGLARKYEAKNQASQGNT